LTSHTITPNRRERSETWFGLDLIADVTIAASSQAQEIGAALRQGFANRKVWLLE